MSELVANMLINSFDYWLVIAVIPLIFILMILLSVIYMLCNRLKHVQRPNKDTSFKEPEISTISYSINSPYRISADYKFESVNESTVGKDLAAFVHCTSL